ncbi:MAG TPA: hypothetical protein VHW23_47285, partial [Kofleriaceae bacterium]|nr:hypothetical protein [Kofleriaceae bacterium]
PDPGSAAPVDSAAGSAGAPVPAGDNGPRDATRGGVNRPALPGERGRGSPLSINELGCPRCRVGKLIAGSRGWGCARWREGCKFVVWFQTAGRRLTPAQLRDLVTRGKTRKARFRADGGAEIDGRLVLDPAVDGGARLEPA